MRIFFSPGRFSRRRREETGASPFRIAVADQGRTPAAETVSVELRPAPDDIARRLGLRHGTEVVHRSDRYLVDGEAVQLGVTYIPETIAAGTTLATTADLGPGSLYARLDELGWPVATIKEEMIARMPSVAEAVALALPPDVPVLEVTHTSMDDWKRPFEVTRFVMRADRAGVQFEADIPD